MYIQSQRIIMYRQNVSLHYCIRHYSWKLLKVVGEHLVFPETTFLSGENFAKYIYGIRNLQNKIHCYSENVHITRIFICRHTIMNRIWAIVAGGFLFGDSWNNFIARKPREGWQWRWRGRLYLIVSSLWKQLVNTYIHKLCVLIFSQTRFWTSSGRVT